MPLFNTVVLDLSFWVLCALALLVFARLSATHPATIYLAFHGWFISARALAILNGAPTLFSWPGATAVSHAEISRAVLLADAALLTMTCGWILAAHRATKLDFVYRSRTRPRALDPEIVHWITAVAIPVGCVATLIWSRLPGVAPHQLFREWADSNWPVIAQTWVGLSLLALIYLHGFRMGLLLPMAGYLALVVYQGNFRFRLLIPMILLAQVYLDREERRWPRLSGIAVLVACGLLFFPLKRIGQQLQAGEHVDAIWQTAQGEIAGVIHGTHPDEMILDEFASALSLADQHGKLYLGSTYSGLLTVAVPRQLWPEKPGLADFEKDISTPSRPMAANGMVVTMLGEFYLNFSYLGIVLIPFVLAYVLGAWFNAAYRRQYLTIGRFAYLLVACNLIEVYRDGLISLFVFTVINMMPLTAIVVVHLFQPAPQYASIQEPLLKTPRVRVRSHEHSVA